jgi:DHA1 family bicyclomycin/chloramphenicol resistance-like MFS transporter
MSSHTAAVSPPASASISPPPVAFAGRTLVLILGALTVIGPLAIDMYLPALPQIARDLGVQLGVVQLTLSVFMIGVAAGQAFYGPLVDRWGRRGPLLIGMAVFTLAGIGCARAETMRGLLFWRLIMALGGSASMVVPRAVVRDFFNERDSARLYSLLMLILGVSPIFAPSLGGQLLALTGWRGIFWVLVGVGAVFTAAVAWWLPESLPKDRRTVGGVGLALRTYGRLLVDRRFIGAALAAGFTLGAIFSYLSGSSFVFIELYALTPAQYALVFGFNGVGLILASQLNRWLLGRFTPWQVLSVAFLANACTGVALAGVGATGWGGLPVLIGLLFLTLSAAGVIFPNIAALAMAPFGAVAGSASALLGTMQFGVGAAAGALVGLLHNGTAVPMTAGVAGCAVAGWIVVRTLVRR